MTPEARPRFDRRSLRERSTAFEMMIVAAGARRAADRMRYREPVAEPAR